MRITRDRSRFFFLGKSLHEYDKNVSPKKRNISLIFFIISSELRLREIVSTVDELFKSSKKNFPFRFDFQFPKTKSSKFQKAEKGSKTSAQREDVLVIFSFFSF